MPFTPPLGVAELQAVLGTKFRDFVPVDLGGQGAVFRAAQAGAGGTPRPDVALKLYFPEQVQERVLREIRTLASIRSAHLVRLLDAGRVSLRGTPCIFVATEFIEGEPLRHRVRRGPIDFTTTLRIGLGVADALSTLWAKRIVHRDIKPDNILVRDNHHPVVIDLGVARHMELPSLTEPGRACGTRGYMSPEQARGLRVLSCKADVFALGIVMQECLLGQHPTRGDQIALSNGGCRTRALVSSCPAQAAELIDGMVAKQPQVRPSPELVATTITNLL